MKYRFFLVVFIIVIISGATQAQLPLIDRMTLEQKVAQMFMVTLHGSVLTEDGALQWHSGLGDPPAVYTTEPHTTWWSRTLAWLLMLLPIEWLL